MGEDYVKSQLLNQETASGDAFSAQSLIDALESYALFMTQKPAVAINIMTLDPSGTGHPFGWFIGGFDSITQNSWEIESGMIQLGNPDADGDNWTIQKIYAFVLSKCREYHVKYFITESNSGGQALALYLRQNGITAILQNFAGELTPTSRSNYIKLARYILEERQTFICNQDLINQLTIYNPNKDKEKHKGDIADAWLHFQWKAYGGVAFLRKILQEQTASPKQAFGE